MNKFKLGNKVKVNIQNKKDYAYRFFDCVNGKIGIVERVSPAMGILTIRVEFEEILPKWWEWQNDTKHASFCENDLELIKED